MARESERRSAFERYIGEISRCCNALTGTNTNKLYKALMIQAKRRTEEADSQLDDEGRVIDDGGRLKKDDDVIIVDEMKDLHKVGDSLFENDKPKKKRAVSKKKKTTRKRRKK
jgi:hypothetical protein